MHLVLGPYSIALERWLRRVQAGQSSIQMTMHLCPVNNMGLACKNVCRGWIDVVL